MTDAGLVAAFGGNTTLESLDLKKLPAITGTGLGVLAGGAPLTKLNLSESSVTDAGI